MLNRLCYLKPVDQRCSVSLESTVLGVTLAITWSGKPTDATTRCGRKSRCRSGPKGRPTAISGESAYLAWWSNKTGNDDVMFRAFAYKGVTFGEKVNLSNTTNAESADAMIDAEGDNMPL